VERAGDMSCLSYACEGRKEGRMDGQRIGHLWVERGNSACLFALSYACEERKDIDAHNVKSECNMKIVPFKGVLWLLGGARRQLHGKGRLRVLWCWLECGVMHAKKGGTSTSMAETLIVFLKLLVYKFL